MRNTLYLFLLAIFLISAGCNPVDDGYEPTPLSEMRFNYVDNEGMDLLDPDTFNQFNIFYLQKNDESGEFELREARSPQYSFFKDPNTLLYGLRLFPNPEYVDGHSTTIIESPRDDMDTLEVQARIEGQGIIPEVVWYNGDKLYERSSNPGPLYFTITKSSGSF